MALINCPDCGEKMSDRAKECIHCGCPVKPDGKKDYSDKHIDEEGGFICNALQFLGIATYIFGIIAGIIYGNRVGYYSFSFITALTVWISAFIIGTLEIAVSVIITLLNKLNQRY